MTAITPISRRNRCIQLFPEPVYGGSTSRKQEADPILRTNEGNFLVGYGGPGVSLTESSMGDIPLGFIRISIQDWSDTIPPTEFSIAHLI